MKFLYEKQKNIFAFIILNTKHINTWNPFNKYHQMVEKIKFKNRQDITYDKREAKDEIVRTYYPVKTWIKSHLHAGKIPFHKNPSSLRTDPP